MSDKMNEYADLVAENAKLKAQAMLDMKEIQGYIDERSRFEAALNLDNERLYEDRDRWKGLCEKFYERMKLINGPDSNCCGINAANCPNHGLIREYEAERGKE
jgi:hypothetical protein